MTADSPGAGGGDGGAPAAGDDVFTVGETMVALRGSGPLRLGGSMNVSIAGAESNVAIGLARLGHRVRWAGAVGDDEAGELVLRTLRAEGVDVSGAARDTAAPTGLLLFEPRLPDLTRVHYYRADSAGSRIDADAVEDAFGGGPRPPRVLHLTGITPSLGPSALAAAGRVLRLAHAQGTLVCLDVNFRSRLWSRDAASAVLREWIPHVDVLVASDDELPLCLAAEDGGGTAGATAAGETPARQAERLLAQGVSEVVVKLGADGAVVHTADTELHSPARPVRAVDAVGAGDAFVAGYLSGLLDGEDIGGRLDRAVTTGAFAVASHGDWEGAPARSELALLGAPPGTVVR